MKITPLLCCMLPLAAVTTGAQQYHNIANGKFNTISNGPMQTVVVDVPSSADDSAVSRAVMQKVASVRAARESIVQRQLSILRRYGVIKANSNPGIPDLVVVRRGGKLSLPARHITRGPNDISITFPAAGASGSWPADQQAQLQQIFNITYPELKNVYGSPSWSGTVMVLNGDNMTPGIPDRGALSGGIFNASTNQITFAQFNAIQTRVLDLTEMIALAMRGPDQISYDAWETGMARAATMIAVNNVKPLLNAAFGTGNVDPSDPLWHALDRYDLLNSPALGNDRFSPVAKANQAVNPSSLAGMLVPRLQMAGSAWLKVATENPLFLNQFNTAYYAAVTTNPSLKNSIPALKALAASVQANVEGLGFSDWYQRQFVLDTSVSPGNKLYPWSFALRPAAGADDFSIGVVLVYYKTVFDSSANSDETNLSGTCYPIYWDYTFANRLFLGSQYERVDVSNGVGSLAPTFFNTIGGDPAQSGHMRIAMDFPINTETARVYVAPRSSGTADAINNFWGVVVGADTGTMAITTDTGANSTLPVVQGAFGGAVQLAGGAGDPLARPTRATLTFTGTGAAPVTRNVDLGYHEFITVMYASDPISSITHTMPQGPAMVSFPIQPLAPKAADALVDPTTGTPLFNDGNLLMARWNQLLSGTDKYQRYPTMEPIRPGLGFWSDFPTNVPVKITGRVATQDNDVSVGLVHGWNQIGNPYQSPIDITLLQFQYLANNQSQDLAGAIAQGWIVAQAVTGAGNVAIWQYNASQGYIPATTLTPWAGYWIRVLVSDGITITYPTPSRAARLRSAKRSAGSAKAVTVGWSLPLVLRGPQNFGSTVYLGQSASGASGFSSATDALMPPAFSRSVPYAAFSHPDWGAAAGDYFSEIHNLGSHDPWTVTLATPQSNSNYTVTWGNVAAMPRTTRLVMLDSATGARQYLDGSSGYTFNSGTSPLRSLQILVEDRSRTALRILDLAVRQTRSSAGPGRVDALFTLTAGATVEAEIRGATGQFVRRLQAGRAASAGTGSLMWDTRNEQGVSVAAGSYILTIHAHTPDGQAATAIQPVLVLR